MNKSILASVIFTTLLSGCGSSGGGSSSGTYNWQMVELRSEVKTNVGSGCIIYSDSDSDPDNVISAYIAETGYKILYHNSNGSVEKEFSYLASENNNGIFQINIDEVPVDGYVSLEEVQNEYSGTPDAYMFSVEKSLLSDLVINVREYQGSGATCYKGSEYNDTVVVSADARVSVQEEPDTQYYQTSYGSSTQSNELTTGQGLDDGGSGGIPVRSPLPTLASETGSTMHDVLVTTFSQYGGSSFEISSYGFLKGDEVIYDEQNPPEVVKSSFLDDTTSTNLYLNGTTDYNVSFDETRSGIYALHDDIIYFWQPLPQEYSQLNTVSDTTEVSHWSASFAGDVETIKWEFESFVAFDSNENDDVALYLPDLYSGQDIEVTSFCSDASVKYCVDNASSYHSENFAYQRTHLRMKNLTRTIVQSIYAPASDSPILLESSYDSLLDNITVDTIELNLIESDVDSIKAIQYLMSQSMDEVALGDDRYNITSFSFNDVNGFVATGDERDALELAIFKSTTLTVKTEIVSAD